MKLTLQNLSERFPKRFCQFPSCSWPNIGEKQKGQEAFRPICCIFFCIQRKRLLSKEHLYVKEIESTLCAALQSQVLCSALANCHTVINNMTYVESLIPKTMPFQNCLKPYGTLGKRKINPTCIVVTVRKSSLVLWLTYGQQMLWQKQFCQAGKNWKKKGEISRHVSCRNNRQERGFGTKLN